VIEASELRLQATATWGFFQRQYNLYKRYWVWEVVWFVYALVSTLSIGYLTAGLDGSTTPAHLQRIQLYLLVGSLLWSYLSLTFFEVSFAITWERWEGTIEYTFMAPVRRVAHLLGVMGFAIVYGMLRTALIVVVVGLAFHLDLSHANLLSALVLVVAATLPLVGLGVLTAMLPLLSPEKGEQMTVAVQGVMLLVSGVYYPVTVLPLPLQWVASISPLTYTLEAARHALLDNWGVIQILPTAALLLGMGAALVVIGFRSFAWAEARAKRLGLLKRAG
jgi:ABC-2 type transport system permease protein